MDRTVDRNKVISLTKLIHDSRFPVQRQLEAYWQTLRGTRLVPARSDVDPRAIEDCLEYAFILERIAPGLGRFRLAGMHLNDLMGMEVRGMPLTALFLPDHRQAISDALERVFSEPARARITLAGGRGIGRPPLDAELTLLPLKSDFGDVTRVLGALTTMGAVGRPPRRFSVTDVQVTPLLTATIHPKATPPESAAEKERAQGFAESAAPFIGAPSSPRPPRTDKPMLRLVKTDD